jgi:hypothetical protein
MQALKTDCTKVIKTQAMTNPFRKKRFPMFVDEQSKALHQG